MKKSSAKDSGVDLFDRLIEGGVSFLDVLRSDIFQPANTLAPNSSTPQIAVLCINLRCGSA